MLTSQGKGGPLGRALRELAAPPQPVPSPSALPLLDLLWAERNMQARALPQLLTPRVTCGWASLRLSGHTPPGRPLGLLGGGGRRGSCSCAQRLLLRVPIHSAAPGLPMCPAPARWLGQGCGQQRPGPGSPSPQRISPHITVCCDCRSPHDILINEVIGSGMRSRQDAEAQDNWGDMGDHDSEG